MSGDGSFRVTWWGHSTVTLEDGGVRLLTDPLLTNRVGHLHRRRGPTPAADARNADAVLISHLHADHLHIPSLRLLPESTMLVVPQGTRAMLAAAHHDDLADRCVEMVAGKEIEAAGAGVRAVPAKHSGRRHPWSSHRAPALGYVVTGPRHVAWFAGDTDLFEGMADLGRLDLALLPIGGWGPSLGPGHLDPERAAEAVRRTTPGVVIPIHYGTFWPVGLNRVRPQLFLGPEREFERRTKAVAPDIAVHVLDPGTAVTLD
ncbi:MBL fold metallo-hydrolase [Spirillospora sp. NPDC048911]|uniref:MBL fold metallo-hydrolase n=1 Tax=Spirillospora sp. NPDC048911 TaxID=3364527 RepID=UPI003716FEE9